jgi:hypothetical protein
MLNLSWVSLVVLIWLFGAANDAEYPLSLSTANRLLNKPGASYGDLFYS